MNNNNPELGISSPVRDLGVSREFGEDIDTTAHSHRQQSMYIGLKLPRRPRRPGKRSKRHTDKNGLVTGEVGNTALTPNDAIQQLFGEVDDESHQKHGIFCQMDVLNKVGTEVQWKESARWVKYEEDVEEGGERWSKPHVASLSLHSMFELRSSILTGAVILDMDAYHISQVADMILENLINSKLLEDSMRDPIKQLLISSHIHQHQKRRKSIMPGDHEDIRGLRKLSMKRTFSEIGRQFSMKNRENSSPHLMGMRNNMKGNPNSVPNFENILTGDLHESPSCSKLNQQFMRKIPEGAEAANILVGEVESLKYQVCAFVRLCEGRTIGDLTEVPVPTRFLVLLLGPPGSQAKNIEIGRSISTILVDEVFQEVAYKARNRQDILAGIDEFLDQVTVLPPGEWDPKIRIEPPESVPSQAGRKVAKVPLLPKKEEGTEEVSHCDPTLTRSGRIFGGLVDDFKRKIPWYPSDFKDSLHIQCIASIIYLYLATLTPNVTFGGLLGQATDQYMGTMECILTASIVGVLFALFSGQPLNILGSTGPMLVLEMIMFHFCDEFKLDFMPFRFWIGMWTSLILMLIVCFDLSALVRYITRFTEESFACLIAIIFIYQAFQKQFDILTDSPVNTNPDIPLIYDCSCAPPNSTFNASDLVPIMDNITGTSNISYNIVDAVYSTLTPNLSSVDIVSFTFLNDTNATNYFNWTTMTKEQCLKNNGSLVGPGCDTPHYAADVFFLSVLLFLGTFTVASTLTNFKNSRFFPSMVRQFLSDFAVLIAIVMMVGLDLFIGIGTKKLEVPEKIAPTRPGRGWIINPISDKNPWWLIIAAVIPALLATILIFMDQQITAVIVNRKENKLKKGSGYHLDLFIVAICIAICSVMGLPWYVAATVSALAHVMSLKKESECTAPGERPTFLGVREQRVTALMVGLLSGLTVLFTSVLKNIPMAVLYGVFLYMGVAALKGMQFIDRLLLIFMPVKYQPDHMYLRHVQIKRVHMFTLVQVFCLVVLWVVKQIKSVSIVFPIMVLGMCFVRKAMDYLFTQRELKWLDDIMPEASHRAKEDAEKGDGNGEDESLLGEEDVKLAELRLQHDKMEKYGHNAVDIDRLNISEEVNRTAIWLQVRRDSMPVLENGLPSISHRNSKRKKDRKKESSKSNGSAKLAENKKAAFYLEEDEEEDCNTIKEIPETEQEMEPSAEEEHGIIFKTGDETSDKEKKYNESKI